MRLIAPLLRSFGPDGSLVRGCCGCGSHGGGSGIPLLRVVVVVVLLLLFVLVVLGHVGGCGVAYFIFTLYSVLCTLSASHA